MSERHQQNENEIESALNSNAQSNRNDAEAADARRTKPTHEYVLVSLPNLFSSYQYEMPDKYSNLA